MDYSKLQKQLEDLEKKLNKIESQINLVDEKTRSKLDYLLKLIQKIKSGH
jgi:chromosome segregation ATPase